jgi:Zn-dependent protease with chaperone function
LWSFVRDVARTIATRPIDEIRVTPGTEMAVYEKGSLKERLRDRGRRVLILGVGTLNGFKQDSFRAVLAHEYGHLSNRDTAGGDVALRVNSDMRKFAEAMIRTNQAVWWNIAFWFLRIYHFIFRRISYGATRLQEVLADRVAVRAYGAAAFEDGLRHVVRRQIEFEDIAYWEITEAVRAHRSISNIYDMSARAENNIEKKIAEAITKASSEEETHPSPADRFRYAKRIATTHRQSSQGMVWDLFSDKESLTREMSALIDKHVKTA